MEKTIANPREPVDPARVIGRASKCMRRLLEAGLPYEALQLPITNPQAREIIVQHWLSLYRDGDLKLSGLPAEEIIKKYAGRIQIFKPREVGKFWKKPIPKNILVPYREETLEWCIFQNTEGEDWRLIFHAGTSARYQRKIIGVTGQPRFYKDNTWWLDEKENSWANATLPVRFWLVNFKPFKPGTGVNYWHGQAEEIQKYAQITRRKVVRCPSNVFRQGVFDAYRQNNGERITGGSDCWYHWGEEETADGRRVFSGSLDGLGFFLREVLHPGSSPNLVRVCLALEADFN
jgi:hypothetical protein